MQIGQQTSIKKKLLIAGVLTTCTVLFLASIVFFIIDILFSRQALLDDLAGYAKTIAANSSAALIFGDRRSANETVSSLKSAQNIKSAVIYDGKGLAFASYFRDGNSWQISYASPPPGYRFTTNYVAFVDTIVLDGETIGTIYLRADLTMFYKKMARYGITLIVVMGLAVIISLFLFSRLHRTTVTPILALTGIMNRVSANQDYSVRGKIYGSDELAFLTQGFNTMLERIQERDVELSEYRSHLEDLVEKRTAELKAANIKLEKELSERIRAEEALTESERRYRTIFETTGAASLIIAADTTILMVNSAFENISGYKRHEVEGLMSWMSLTSEEDIEKIMEYHDARRTDSVAVPIQYEWRLKDRNGKIHNAIMTAAIIPGTDRSIASLLDMTEQKRLEEQLMQSQKMEAIGQLAGGVAHDFNNILTAIIGYGNLLQMKAGHDIKIQKYIQPILTSADRAKHLTQALLAFSRKQIITPKPIDLNEVVNNVRKLLIRLMGEEIEMTTRLTNDDIIVFADPGQIEQVLMNFATNARDAMPDGGTFSIETQVAILKNDFFRKYPSGEPGPYALMTVSDTGCGIDRQALEHIFEPFFTTKEVGKGTGLGLSIVYGIIRQSNGYINVYSEPHNGTTFRIYLPLMASRAETVEEQSPDELRGGKETILVAEDDEQSRTLIKEILEEFGYTVLVSTDGDDALLKMSQHHTEVDLVILDVIMPKKNGKMVYEEIRSTFGNIPALFISGYTADIIHKKGIVEDDINFLSKPIIVRDFLITVRNILDNT